MFARKSRPGASVATDTRDSADNSATAVCDARIRFANKNCVTRNEQRPLDTFEENFMHSKYCAAEFARAGTEFLGAPIEKRIALRDNATTCGDNSFAFSLQSAATNLILP
jgi:hypothetical protein